MVIHFICRGNTFRSRLAQAYMCSKVGDQSNLHIISSGIEADKRNGQIAPWTQQLLLVNHLLSWADTHRTQTNQTLIDQSNLIVFMNDDVYKDAAKVFKLPSSEIQVWHVPDVDESALDTNAIFELIKKNVDQLIISLKSE